MFTASADTIKKLTADGRYIGGDLPGFFGALHTWAEGVGTSSKPGGIVNLG